MTLSDLFTALYRSWKLVVVLPVVLTLACASVLFQMPSKWEAEASLITIRTAAIEGLAKGVVEANGSPVSVSGETSKKKITLWVSGSDPAECVAMVNAVAQDIVGVASEVYPGTEVSLIEATAAEDISPAKIPYLAIAFLAGLFFVICFVVLVDIICRPAKSIEEVGQIFKTKALGTLRLGSEDDAEMLSSKLKLVAGDAKTLCLASVDCEAAAEKLCEDLAKHYCGEASIFSVGSISSSAKSLQAVHDAQATLLVVEEWKTAESKMEAVVRDLSVASAKVVGFVVLKSKSNGVECISLLAGMFWRGSSNAR